MQIKQPRLRKRLSDFLKVPSQETVELASKVDLWTLGPKYLASSKAFRPVRDSVVAKRELLNEEGTLRDVGCSC